MSVLEPVAEDVVSSLYEGEIIGVWDAIAGVHAYPKLLSYFVSSGALAPDTIMRFLSETGAGGELFGTTAANARDDVMRGPRWLMTFVNYFMGYTQSHVDHADDWIPIAELHRPHVEGCTATLSFSQGQTESNAFKVAAGGFAGGAGYSKTIRHVSGTMTPHLSQRLEARARLKIITYKHSNGHEIKGVSVEDIFDELRYTSILNERNGADIDQLLHQVRHASVRSADRYDFSETITIQFGCTHEFSWKFMLDELIGEKGSVSLSAKSQILTKAELRFELKPGLRYAFCPTPPGSHVVLVYYDENASA